MALTEKIGLKVTAREKRALRWMAKKLLLSRYPGGSTKMPGAGVVLRTMSLEQVMQEYDAAMAARKEPEAVAP